jgi:hypothetical protein
MNYFCLFLLFVRLSVCVFFKRKREKRKQKIEPAQKPKGNGISPEGWKSEERAFTLCRSLLAYPKEQRGIVLSCAFYPFRLKNVSDSI